MRLDLSRLTKTAAYNELKLLGALHADFSQFAEVVMPPHGNSYFIEILNNKVELYGASRHGARHTVAKLVGNDEMSKCKKAINTSNISQKSSLYREFVAEHATLLNDPEHSRFIKYGFQLGINNGAAIPIETGLARFSEFAMSLGLSEEKCFDLPANLRFDPADPASNDIIAHVGRKASELTAYFIRNEKPLTQEVFRAAKEKAAFYALHTYEYDAELQTYCSPENIEWFDHHENWGNVSPAALIESQRQRQDFADIGISCDKIWNIHSVFDQFSEHPDPNVQAEFVRRRVQSAKVIAIYALLTDDISLKQRHDQEYTIGLMAERLKPNIEIIKALLKLEVLSKEENKIFDASLFKMFCEHMDHSPTEKITNQLEGYVTAIGNLCAALTDVIREGALEEPSAAIPRNGDGIIKIEINPHPIEIKSHDSIVQIKTSDDIVEFDINADIADMRFDDSSDGGIQVITKGSEGELIFEKKNNVKGKN
jgi:hypothetical protein